MTRALALGSSVSAALRRPLVSSCALPAVGTTATTTAARPRSSVLAARRNPTTATAAAATAAAAFSSSARTMGAGLGAGEDNSRPAPDKVLQDIADYVHSYDITSDMAYRTARLDLLDTLGCGIEALRFPQAKNITGPVVPGTVVPNGARVIGTEHILDPIRAAFENGALVRWLDFNDTWLAAEWGHPSDNIGAILSVADWISRERVAKGQEPLTVKDVLEGAIKAHEIQGLIAIENSFNKVGLDHVVLVKVASAAVVSKLLGNTRDQTVDVVSQAFVDGQSLRTYRHAPNAGSRKSWAAGDACGRAVNLALLVKNGEMGYPSVLTAPVWGFYDVLFKGKPFEFQRTYGSYVMENVLFKLAPAEFHAQTAVEAARELYKQLKAQGKSADDIESIKLKTQEAAIRIISKAGKLNNYADRDHSLQYMVAVPLIHGVLEPHMYTDEFAADPKIDELRAKMTVEEEPRYTAEYLEPEKRSIGNSVELVLKDGTTLGPVAIDYPVGHARRRTEAIPLIAAKLDKHLEGFFPEETKAAIKDFLKDENHDKLASTPVHKFVDLWVKPEARS